MSLSADDVPSFAYPPVQDAIPVFEKEEKKNPMSPIVPYWKKKEEEEKKKEEEEEEEEEKREIKKNPCLKTTIAVVTVATAINFFVGIMLLGALMVDIIYVPRPVERGEYPHSVSVVPLSVKEKDGEATVIALTTVKFKLTSPLPTLAEAGEKLNEALVPGYKGKAMSREYESFFSPSLPSPSSTSTVTTTQARTVYHSSLRGYSTLSVAPSFFRNSFSVWGWGGTL